MSAPDTADEPPDALAREAAQWFAHMRRPQAEASRDAFDSWLAESPEHRVAYSRAAEIFALGKLLAQPDAPVPIPPRGSRRPVAIAVAACAVGALAFGGWATLLPVTRDETAPATITAASERRSLSTVIGETRVARLADGSTVRLAGDTLLEVAIDGARRSLSLVRGQARFEVAHESRPFVVLAGGGSVTARGTIFEVQLAGDAVDVRLLQGAVDVAFPRRNDVDAPSALRRLAAGERVSFTPVSPAPAALASASSATPANIHAPVAQEFQAVDVSTLVAWANRGAVRPIRLGDSSLGAERVSGRFRVDDTELLARRLAALFGASVDTTNAKEIVLRRAGEPR